MMNIKVHFYITPTKIFLNVGKNDNDVIEQQLNAVPHLFKKITVKNDVVDPIRLAAKLKVKHEGSYLLSIISGDGDCSHVTYFDI